MEKVTEIKAALAAAVAVLTALWGWFGWIIMLWVACMVVDYLTGTLAAASSGTWSSATARAGILHKAGMVIVVCVAAGADKLLATIIENLPAVQLPFEYTVLLCPLVVVWYIITELGSIVENAVALGAPCPDWLAKILDVAQGAVDAAGEIGGKEHEDH